MAPPHKYLDHLLQLLWVTLVLRSLKGVGANKHDVEHHTARPYVRSLRGSQSADMKHLIMDASDHSNQTARCVLSNPLTSRRRAPTPHLPIIRLPLGGENDLRGEVGGCSDARTRCGLELLMLGVPKVTQLDEWPWAVV